MSIKLADTGRMAAALSRAAAASGDRRHWALVWLTPAQRLAVVAVLAASAVLALAWPRLLAAMLVAFMCALYAVHTLFRMIVWLAGLKPAPNFALKRSDDQLPVYSIIAPLRHEANMADKIVAALERLDYPRAKLDVIFAVDHDDRETLDAFERTALPDWMRVAVVPQSALPSKPRACNHALAGACGDFVVVFDAEDRPEPGQLKQAVAAFDAYGETVACLQARLVPHNRAASIVARMFTLDYCQLFDSTLTGLVRLGYPVPLGGTSNHFRTRILVESGAWDPYNVTEDADLGYRLARLGHGVRTLNATTFEEAPVGRMQWFLQRTRWIKGYMQTLFVHMRAPASLGLPPLNGPNVLGLGLFLGASVIFALVNPIFWALGIWSLFAPSDLDWLFGPDVAPLARISLWVGNGLGIVMALCAPLRRGWWSLVPWALLTPLYWIAVSAAAYFAAVEFVVRPFRWRKTAHGVELRGVGRVPRATWALSAALSAAALTSKVESGAWAQPEDYGFALDQFGLAYGRDGGRRQLFEGYGELGFGDDWTLVYKYEADSAADQGSYVWRIAGGLRRTFELAQVPDWVFAAEGSLRYQGHTSVVFDPVFAGDGFGGAVRLDAGTAFDLFGRHGFANLSGGYVVRRLAPDEVKLEAVAGLDLSDTWQAGTGYFGSIAPGKFFEPGAYEKHEVQAWLRWAFDVDYAVQLSVSQTFLTDRTPQETTLRLAVWSFIRPDEAEVGDDR